MKILVVGAGIIGSFTAASLADQHIEVELVEREHAPFQGSSRAAFGSLTPFSDPFFRGDARAFAARSVELYREKWSPILSMHGAKKFRLHDLGLLELFVSEQELEERRPHISELTHLGYKVDLLSAAQVRKLEPALTESIVGALWLDEPWLDKDILYASLISFLEAAPTCHFNHTAEACRVHRVDGEHVTVAFTDGSSRAFDFVVLCTGLSNIDGVLPLPFSWVRGDCIGVVTPNDRPCLARHVYMHNGFITPRENGYMLLGATYVDENGPPDPSHVLNRDQITVRQVQHLLRNNLEILPFLADCELVGAWRGWRPGMPDQYPVLGLTEIPRVIIANGFIGLGVTMAPAVGNAIASYVTAGDVGAFPVSFSPSRSALKAKDGRHV